MQRGLKHQTGKTLLIIAVLLVLGIGFTVYKNESRKAAAIQQAQREADLKAQQTRADQEREALKKAAEEAKAKDILATALKSADDLMARWDDASTVASSTARMSLSGTVANLQAIKRDATALTVPPCLTEGKAELIKGMELMLEGYLEFMANTGKLGGVLAASKFDEAKPHIDSYKTARSACPTP